MKCFSLQELYVIVLEFASENILVWASVHHSRHDFGFGHVFAIGKIILVWASVYNSRYDFWLEHVFAIGKIISVWSSFYVGV